MNIVAFRMSLAKKGLRTIVVDGEVYEWTICMQATSSKAYHIKALKAAIQSADPSEKGILLVDFGVSPPGNKTNPHKTSVTPQIIAKVIKMGISKGWNRKKGNFKIIYPLKFVPDLQNPSPNRNYDMRWPRPDDSQG